MGTGRSGTSAVAGALHRLGVHMGFDFLAPDSANPGGYYEDQDMLRLHRQFQHEPNILPLTQKAYRREIDRRILFPIWGIKDPRLSDGDVFWESVRLIEGHGLADARIVICTRPHLDVVNSYRRAYRAGWIEAIRWWAGRTWSLNRIRGQWPGPMHEVRYRDLWDSPESIVDGLDRFCYAGMTDHRPPQGRGKEALKFLHETRPRRDQ